MKYLFNKLERRINLWFILLEQLLLFVRVALVCRKICHRSDTLENIMNITSH